MANAGSEESTRSGSEWGPKTWIGIISALAALISALAAFAPKGGNVADHAKPLPRRLIWAPSDCSMGAEARVALDSCNDSRTLDWLEGEINKLRSEAISGFGVLPKGFRLEASDFGTKVNYRLNVKAKDGTSLFSVGVGYNAKTNAKDGGLHLYKDGGLVAEAWLLPDGSWVPKVGG